MVVDEAKNFRDTALQLLDTALFYKDKFFFSYIYSFDFLLDFLSFCLSRLCTSSSMESLFR